MYRTQYLVALASAGCLAMVIILVATLGVQRPGGCHGITQDDCYEQDGCGWMCASAATCYCSPVNDVDLAPLTWVAVLASGVVLASTLGCVVEMRATRFGHRYDAL